MFSYWQQIKGHKLWIFSPFLFNWITSLLVCGLFILSNFCIDSTITWLNVEVSSFSHSDRLHEIIFVCCLCLFLAAFPHSSFSPGVSCLIRLLSSAGEESQPGLIVLLCEILTAVFLSLFVHGMATHSCNELFRIVAHPLNFKLWVTVFGGGARLPVVEKPNSPTRTPPPGDCSALSRTLIIIFFMFVWENKTCFNQLHFYFFCFFTRHLNI